MPARYSVIKTNHDKITDRTDTDTYQQAAYVFGVYVGQCLASLEQADIAVFSNKGINPGKPIFQTSIKISKITMSAIAVEA